MVQLCPTLGDRRGAGHGRGGAVETGVLAWAWLPCGCAQKYTQEIAAVINTPSEDSDAARTWGKRSVLAEKNSSVPACGESSTRACICAGQQPALPAPQSCLNTADTLRTRLN